MSNPSIGIYEKALPDLPDWPSRLAAAAEAGYDFVEIPVDETEEKLSRLDWTTTERAALRSAVTDTGVDIGTVILSAHRKFPLGSASVETREKALDLFKKAVDLAVDLNASTIQLAGYFVYYEKHDEYSKDRFMNGLSHGLDWATPAGIMLGLETMDGEDITSVSTALEIVQKINSPILKLYPDVGNLIGNGFDVSKELKLGKGQLIGIHLKDARPGQYRRVPFGTGDVPFVDVFRTLSDIEYDGNFLIEMWNDSAPDSMETITNARAWIVDKMLAAGYFA